MQSTSITDSQHLPVTFQPTDASGKPGQLAPGAVATWTTSDPTVAVAAGDAGDTTGLTAVVSAVGPGTCQITCNDTNPSGTFFTSFSLTVLGGPATGGNFIFGTPS
jgi:uncharacterized protein YjdB